MQLILTWDLLIIVFFAIVIAYSFIIGKHESVKIVIASYIASVAVQGIGNILERLTGESEPLLQVVGMSVDMPMLSTLKLLLFITTIVFLAIRGGFEVQYTKESGSLLDTLLTGAFGFATAGLLLSTLLTYIAGVPLLDANLAKAAAVSPLLEQSSFVEILVLNQNLWFALPALLLLGAGFIGGRE